MSQSERRYDVDPGVEAMIRLEEHEKACAERMTEVRRALGTISTRLWWILGAAVAGACTMALEMLKRAV